MYIVRRAFRGPNGPMSVGSIVEPSDIKRFRYHLQEKHIVEVNEQNLSAYADLFKARFSLNLHAIYAKGTEKAPTVPETRVDNEPEPVKVSVKVIVK